MIILYFSGIVSSILNGLVVYVCVRKMRSLVSCDFFILNLAVVDIFMLVVGFPLTIYSSFMHKWIIGDFRKYFFGKSFFLKFYFAVFKWLIDKWIGWLLLYSVQYMYFSFFSGREQAP